MNHLGKNKLTVASMGKRLTVTGVFLSDADANAWLEKNKDHGVVSVLGPVVLTANLYDKGTA